MVLGFKLTPIWIQKTFIDCLFYVGFSNTNEGNGFEGSQMLFYVWFEFTSWLRGVGQGKGAWDCFLTIWAWDSCAFCQWDQWLLRDWTFILQMTLSWPDVDSLGLLPSALMFCLNLKKVPPPILTIKIPCKNDLRWDLRWLQITTHVIE